MAKKQATSRIIAGDYKGTKLSFKPNKNLRPTESKTKETLFNWLLNDLHKKKCLDMNGSVFEIGDQLLEILDNGIFTTGEKCDEFWFYNEKDKKYDYIQGYRSICKYLNTILKSFINKRYNILNICELLKNLDEDDNKYEEIYESIKSSINFYKNKINKPSQLKEILFSGLVPEIQFKGNYNDFFNTTKDLFPAKNGMIDLKTGKFIPRTKKHKCTKVGPVDYEENLNTDWVRNVYKEVFDNDEIVEFLQMMKGYTLTGNNNLSTCMICHGCGSNFKSLISDSLTVLFDESSISPIPEIIFPFSFRGEREKDSFCVTSSKITRSAFGKPLSRLSSHFCFKPFANP